MTDADTIREALGRGRHLLCPEDAELFFRALAATSRLDAARADAERRAEEAERAAAERDRDEVKASVRTALGNDRWVHGDYYEEVRARAERAERLSRWLLAAAMGDDFPDDEADAAEAHPGVARVIERRQETRDKLDRAPLALAQVKRERDALRDDRCPTCGESHDGGMFCSNAFHCCRACRWEGGRRVQACARCASEEATRDRLAAVEGATWRLVERADRDGLYYQQTTGPLSDLRSLLDAPAPPLSEAVQWRATMTAQRNRLAAFEAATLRLRTASDAEEPNDDAISDASEALYDLLEAPVSPLSEAVRVLTEALDRVKILAADREAFVMLGARAFVQAEQIAVAALAHPAVLAAHGAAPTEDR